MKLTPYQEFIHVSRYARWLDDEQRRETWPETVDRYISFMKDHLEAYGVKRGDEAFKQVRLRCILPPSCVGAHAAESGGDGVLPPGAPADGRAAAPPRDRTCCCCSGAGRARCGGRAERQAGPHREGAAGV